MSKNPCSVAFASKYSLTSDSLKVYFSSLSLFVQYDDSHGIITSDLIFFVLFLRSTISLNSFLDILSSFVAMLSRKFMTTSGDFAILDSSDRSAYVLKPSRFAFSFLSLSIFSIRGLLSIPFDVPLLK